MPRSWPRLAASTNGCAVVPASAARVRLLADPAEALITDAVSDADAIGAMAVRHQQSPLRKSRTTARVVSTFGKTILIAAVVIALDVDLSRPGPTNARIRRVRAR